MNIIPQYHHTNTNSLIYNFRDDISHMNTFYEKNDRYHMILIFKLQSKHIFHLLFYDYILCKL